MVLPLPQLCPLFSLKRIKKTAKQVSLQKILLFLFIGFSSVHIKEYKYNKKNYINIIRMILHSPTDAVCYLVKVGQI
jgi:hypothetical protein